MKPTIQSKQIQACIILFLLILFFGGCTTSKVTKLRVQRPSRLHVDSVIKKIFILPDVIKASNDQLSLKTQVLRSLQQELNRQGRYQVMVGPPTGIDSERETFAIIQGEIISGQNIDDGQISEVATCKGGLTGFAGGVTAISSSKQGVTLSRRGLLCKAGDMTSTAVGAGVGAMMALAGVEAPVSPIDEVVRVYKYKNIALFLQANFSLTMIGKKRETLAIRSNSARFGRQVVQKAVNVHESYLSLPEALPLIVLPVTPLYIRSLAIVDASNPATTRGNYVQWMAPKAENLSPQERNKVIIQLVQEAIRPFVKTISPYTENLPIEIAKGGDSRIPELLEQGKWKQARVLLEGLATKTADDTYNLGLTYEAGSITQDDFEEAKRYYIAAFNQEPEEIIYAQGIGRMERRIVEAQKAKGRLQQETQ